MASFADESIWSREVYLVGNGSRKNRTPNDKIGVDRRFVKFFGSKPHWKHLYFRDTKRLYVSFWEWSCSSEDF
jgi:hypothetical protein